MTNTAALMSPFLAGIVLCKSPCRLTTASRSAPERASSSTLPPPKQKPTAAFFELSPTPCLLASATRQPNAALTRFLPSTRSARTAIIHSCEVGGPEQVLPSPYMSATSATYLSPAIFWARLIAGSGTPAKFGITSSKGRLPLTFSFHTSACLALTLPHG